MTGRPSKCGRCGACDRCRRAATQRAWWARQSAERKAEIRAARDVEKMRRADRARHRRHHEKRLADARERAARDREQRNESARAWAERNPEKRRAHWAVRNAIRDGRLERGPCEVCGAEQVHAHHDDYSKPLDVRWLCTAHHGQEHRRYDEAA